MTTRWWAPTGPAIGLDDQDRTLLTALGDPKADLGASFLAHHRIGASACLMAAQSPLVDDTALVEYLALARQSYAEPLVESISKSVGEGPYAGLLVRDLADDAERAAVDLFRAAVAKGVAPPLAAQRVGMVYGVPSDSLGAFRTLAVVPGSPVASLADAADRVLFEHVEKLVGLELEHVEAPWEPVSKETREEGKAAHLRQLVRTGVIGPYENDPQDKYEAEHNVEHGEDGRFQRAGAAEEDYAGPQVGAKPPTRRALTRADSRRKGLVPTGRAANRRAAPKKAPEAAQTAAPTAAKAKIYGTRAIPVAESVVLQPSKERMTAQQAAEVENFAGAKADIQWSDGKFTVPITDGTDYNQVINRPVGVAMSAADYRALISHFGKTSQGKNRFRMGHVQDKLGVDYLGGVNNRPSPHAEKVQQIADNEWQRIQDMAANKTKPLMVYVSDDELRGMEGQEEAAYRQDLKVSAVEDWMDENNLTEDTLGQEAYDTLKAQALQRMKPGRASNNMGDVYIWAHHNSADVAIVEFVMHMGSAKGIDYGSDNHPDLRLDPNQMWVVDNERPVMTFDPQAMAWRMRYELRPEFDVDKADTTYETVHHVTHGEGGRFVSTGKTREVTRQDNRRAAKTPQGRAGNRRQAPAVRDTPVATRAALQAEKTSVAGSKIITPATRKALQAQVAQLELTGIKTQPPAGAIEVTSEGHYSVLSPEEFRQLQGIATEHGHFRYNMQRVAATQGAVGGKAADYQMKEMVRQDLLIGGVGQMYEEVPSDLVLNDHDSDAEHAAAIHAEVLRIFDQKPHIQQLLIDYDHDGTVTFHANSQQAEKVVLIDQTHVDISKPMMLLKGGTKHYDQMIPDWDDPFNPVDLRRKGANLEESFWDEDDVMHNTLPLMEITRPIFDYYRLVNVDPDE